MFLTAVDLSSDNVNREIVQLETTMGPHRSHRSILGKTIGLPHNVSRKRFYMYTSVRWALL